MLCLMLCHFGSVFCICGAGFWAGFWAALGGVLDGLLIVVVGHARYVTLQMAEVAIARPLFREFLRRINRLKM